MRYVRERQGVSQQAKNSLAEEGPSKSTRAEKKMSLENKRDIDHDGPSTIYEIPLGALFKCYLFICPFKRRNEFIDFAATQSHRIRT